MIYRRIPIIVQCEPSLKSNARAILVCARKLFNQRLRALIRAVAMVIHLTRYI